MKRINGFSRHRGDRASVDGLRALGGLVVFVPAVAAVWLFIAAIPALADGGPHVSAINNGSLGINADSCAGCHRAHTAQAAFLLVSSGDLCLACHGTTGTGATTDVENGIQYTLAKSGQVRGTAVLGALRNGGFVNARIGSGNAYRTVSSTGSIRTKVPALGAGQAVTSSHLDLDGAGGVVASDVVWGNGAISSTPYAGTKVTGMECTTCHNPHGNGQFRILNPIPDMSAEATGGTSFLAVASPGALVTDAPLPPSGDTRNYTVIQVAGTGSLLASQVSGYPNTAGDYFHRRVPWNTSGAADAPNGQSSTFNPQITAWCTACHTRYYEPNGDTDSGDAIFRYRHDTTSNRACTTCHVAHGSNAQMSGTFSASMPLPGQITLPAEQTGNSRLLKIDNRGTCQACHDPTGTAPPSSGPVPVPLVP